MREGSVEYYLRIARVGKEDSPEYSTELTIKIRPYNEVSLEGINLSLDLIDEGLVKRITEETKRKLLEDKSQDMVASEGRQLLLGFASRQRLPEFQEEGPVTKEEPGELTSDEKEFDKFDKKD